MTGHAAVLVRLHDDASAFGCQCGSFMAAGPDAYPAFVAHRAYQFAAASAVPAPAAGSSCGVEAAAALRGLT